MRSFKRWSTGANLQALSSDNRLVTRLLIIRSMHRLRLGQLGTARRDLSIKLVTIIIWAKIRRELRWKSWKGSLRLAPRPSTITMFLHHRLEPQALKTSILKWMIKVELSHWPNGRLKVNYHYQIVLLVDKAQIDQCTYHKRSSCPDNNTPCMWNSRRIHRKCMAAVKWLWTQITNMVW